jgi:hypothetical protein
MKHKITVKLSATKTYYIISDDIDRAKESARTRLEDEIDNCETFPEVEYIEGETLEEVHTTK